VSDQDIQQQERSARRDQGMKPTQSKNMLIGAVANVVACLLQIVGLVRYVGRLPDDRVGIGLYVVTAIAFALGAFGFYARWKKGNREE
jgi:hypothetical protein